jgi:sugar lactone lactonase YvrE
MTESKYRPMGLAEGPDGSLYVSESKQGKIWRIIFNGNRETFNKSNLVKMDSLKKHKSYLKKPDIVLDLVNP